jgi:hypothetical protein
LRCTRWKLESIFNGRFIADIEKKNNPSGWITLNALKVFKGFAAQPQLRIILSAQYNTTITYDGPIAEIWLDNVYYY